MHDRFEFNLWTVLSERPQEGSGANETLENCVLLWSPLCWCGRGYWDFGNGFGYMPPDPFYDKIISGFSLSREIKQRLYTGSGRGLTIW